MSQVSPINQSQAVYNAVKIKINNPQANIPAGIKDNDGNREYNAVNIEVTEPELQSKKKPVFVYPEYNEMITYDMANVAPVDVPQIPIVPVAYKTSFINNKTYINTELDSDAQNFVDTIDVPEPNVTNTEAEKTLSFHGINFKAAANPEIAKSANIEPSVDINKVIKGLESEDFDIQAKQMEEIVATVLENQNNAVPYITTAVFTALINILDKDTSSLQGPDEAQTEIRKKIIINELLKEQQIAENKKPDEIKLPFELTEDDYKAAIKLNPLEMAERNKEYAVYTIATLAKSYADDFEKETGNVVPLTDLPGVSNIVDTLKKSDDSSLKVTALETLLYINRPEYKDEMSAIFKIAASDKDKMVAQTAALGLQMMEGKLS